MIPPALLIAAGLAAVRYAGATEVDEAVRIGPAVAIGYLPFAAVGVFLFAIPVGGSSGQATLLPAIVLGGIVHPVGFGALGAALGTALGAGS